VGPCVYATRHVRRENKAEEWKRNTPETPDQELGRIIQSGVDVVAEPRSGRTASMLPYNSPP
jgi:hypothetical protein